MFLQVGNKQKTFNKMVEFEVALTKGLTLSRCAATAELVVYYLGLWAEEVSKHSVSSGFR